MKTPSAPRTTRVKPADAATALLAAVEAGDPDTARRWMPHCTVEKLTEALCRCAETGLLDLVRELIPLSDPKSNNSEALTLAAAAGHLEIVHPVSDPKANGSDALCEAAVGGHLEVVQELLPVSDPSVDSYYPLRQSATHGHVEIVRLLIPVSDPAAEDGEALRWAARYGQLDVVRELLPVSNVAADGGGALLAAVLGEHEDVVRELLPWTDPTEVLDDLLGIIGGGSSGRSYESALRGLNVLTPHVDDALLEHAVRRLPKRLLPKFPHLAAWQQKQRLIATLPAAKKAGRRKKPL